MGTPKLRPAGESERAIPRRFAFSVQRLNAVPLPEPGKQRMVYDERTPGLCLLVTGGGARTLYWYRKVDGEPERLKIGGFPEISIEQARKLAEKYNGRKADGHNPRAERRALRADATLVELWDKWHDEHAKPRLRARTLATDVSRWETCLSDWSTRRVHSVTTADVQRKLNEIGESRGRTTANRAIQLLRRLLRFARVEPNPIVGVRLFREEVRERYLSGDEIGRLLAALNDEPNQGIADFVRLALLTGQRRGNVASMAWGELDLKARIWVIPSHKFKTAKPLRVPLVDAAMEVIKAREGNGSEWVFPGPGETGHLVEPKAGWDRILKRAKLEDIHLHDLRHTFASWAVQQGATLYAVGKVLGHANQSTTQRYSHHAINPLRATAESAVDAMLKAAGAAPPQPPPEDLSAELKALWPTLTEAQRRLLMAARPAPISDKLDG